MPIHAVCPRCQAVYNLVDTLAGKIVRCKACQEAFTVTQAPPAPGQFTDRPRPPVLPKAEPPRVAKLAEPLPDDEDEDLSRRRRSRKRDYDEEDNDRDERDDDDEDDRKRRRRRNSSSGTSWGWILAGVGGASLIILIVVVLVIVLVNRGSGPGNTVMNMPLTHSGNLSFGAARHPMRGNFAHTFHIALQAGRTYEFNLHSNIFDAFLILEAPNGQVVAQDDDGGAGLDARIVHTANQTGTYRLVVTTFNQGERGPYNLLGRQIR